MAIVPPRRRIARRWPSAGSYSVAPLLNPGGIVDVFDVALSLPFASLMCPVPYGVAPAPSEAALPESSAASLPDMLTVIRMHLGLTVTHRKAAVDVLVVDSYNKKPRRQLT